MIGDASRVSVQNLANTRWLVEQPASVRKPDNDERDPGCVSSA